MMTIQESKFTINFLWYKKAEILVAMQYQERTNFKWTSLHKILLWIKLNFRAFFNEQYCSYSKYAKYSSPFSSKNSLIP